MAKQQGFTLVELSVVILVISLLVGGIVVGQTLVRASQLRSVASEYTSYTQAIKLFSDKYMALPGDFSNAESLWGADASCPTTTTNTVIKKATCNGNGDGLIVANVAGTRIDEQFRAWQHLSNAGFVSAAFTGVSASAGGSRDRQPGINIPASKLSEAGWGLISISLSDMAGGYADIAYTAPDMPPNHVLWIGGRSVSATADSQTPQLTAGEAADLDNKLDNGSPLTGKIVAQANGSTGTCVSAGAYAASGGGMVCALVFKTGF